MFTLSWLLALSQAGTWVREPGQVYGQLSTSYSTATRMATESGALRPMASRVFLGPVVGPMLEDARFESSELAAYLEVGIGPKNSWLHAELVGKLPVRSSVMRWQVVGGRIGPINQHNFGLADAEIGAAVGWVKPFALSLRSLARLPLYDNRPSKLNRRNTDFADDAVTLGQGTVDLDTTLQVGVPHPLGWAQAGGGVRVRDRGFATAVPLSAQLGWRILEPMALLTELDALHTLSNGERATQFLDAWGKSPDIIDQTQSVSAGAGLLLGGKKGIAIRTQRVLWGRRTPLTHTFSIALYQESP